jgi:hypothetical protein
MALWGTADSIFSPGTIASVDYAAKTITGSGTSFTAAAVGSVISIGIGNTYGEAVISGITSDTLISVATTQYLSDNIAAGVAYTLSQKPVYTLGDSHYGSDEIKGVDIYETNAIKTTSYAVQHAGWVGVVTYTDTHGNLRVKSETLVAFSGITTETTSYEVPGDAEDDATYPDRFITISSWSASPSSTVGVGTTVTLTVAATAYPSATLTYQYQRSTTSNGSVYANLGVTTSSSSVSIANTNTSNDEFNYRVVITADGGASATSGAINLIVS